MICIVHVLIALGWLVIFRDTFIHYIKALKRRINETQTVV